MKNTILKRGKNIYIKSILVCVLLLYASCGWHEETIVESMPSDKNSQVTLNSQQTYPTHWRSIFVSEPIFNGKIHIVESGIKQKQTIILVHGLGQIGLNDWLNVIPVLEKQFHVISFDLPGFGQSDVNQGLYSPSNYSQLIHWLVERYATDKVFVLGHSIGGAISLRYVHDYQNEVSKLFLVDVAGILQRTIFVKHLARAKSQKLSNRLYGLFSGVVPHINVLSENLLETADNLPDFSKFVLHNDIAKQYLFKDRAILNASLSLIEEDFSQAIREIKVPTHIIWGEKDPIAPLRTGKILSGIMTNASLTVLPNIGHVPMNEAPDQFNKILLKKLSEDNIQYQAFEPISSTPLKDVYCKNRNGMLLIGNYRNIVINNCEYIKMNNVFAQSITIIESTVTMENVRVSSDDIALYAENSIVEGTLVVLEGKQPLKVDGSRIDLAGSSLIGESNNIEVKRKSKIYFSVSDMKVKDSNYYLHGAYRVENTTISGVKASE